MKYRDNTSKPLAKFITQMLYELRIKQQQLRFETISAPLLRESPSNPEIWVSLVGRKGKGSSPVLPDGLDQLPPKKILFLVILTLVIREEVFNKA